jgi:hypothetical protein
MNLDKLKELCDRATPGPWETNHSGTHVAFRQNPNGSIGDYHFATIHGHAHDLANNGRFIAAAREAMPKLIAEIDRLRAALHLGEKMAQEFETDSMSNNEKAALKAFRCAVKGHRK